jgi:hypothetical protein
MLFKKKRGLLHTSQPEIWTGGVRVIVVGGRVRMTLNFMVRGIYDTRNGGARNGDLRWFA